MGKDSNRKARKETRPGLWEQHYADSEKLTSRSTPDIKKTDKNPFGGRCEGGNNLVEGKPGNLVKDIGLAPWKNRKKWEQLYQYIMMEKRKTAG